MATTTAGTSQARANRLQPVKLVVGLPVRNGESYLAEGIESILGQTFGGFTLIISDNASTDATEEICRAYARRDSRVIYRRQEKNIGAAPNFNAVFQPGDAPYFKWAAHDDVLKPNYFKKCIQLLDRNPSLAIAHSRSAEIDEHGCQVGTYDHEFRLNGYSPSSRFWRLLWAGYFTEVFGVMRSELVTKTQLMGSYLGSDRNFLAEMLLLGDVGYVEQYLFLRRNHPDTYCNKYSSDADRLKWVDTSKRIPSLMAGPVKLKEYVTSLLRLSLPKREVFACALMILDWAARRGYERLTGDGDRYRRRLHKRYAAKSFGTSAPQAEGALSDRAAS